MWPFTKSARVLELEAALAQAHAGTEQRVAEAIAEARAVYARRMRLLSERHLDALTASRRVHERNVVLCIELDEAKEAEAKAQKLAQTLQASLDDALGLNKPAVKAGASWQERRPDLPRRPVKTPQPEGQAAP